jgi:DNA-binding response OmpR family regulator
MEGGVMADPLAGKRILVVEDEYFIASDLKRALAEAHATVVGPVCDIEKGLAIVASQQLDAAILDVNLEGAHCYPVADALAAHDVPFLFTTGYDAWALPENYRSVPRITKPFLMRAVIACVERLVAEARA